MGGDRSIDDSQKCAQIDPVRDTGLQNDQKTGVFRTRRPDHKDERPGTGIERRGGGAPELQKIRYKHFIPLLKMEWKVICL